MLPCALQRRFAGRVQSVALRLVCEREAEVEAFVPVQYWSIEAALRVPGAPGPPFAARLTHADGQKLGQLSIGDKGRAEELAARLRAAELGVKAVAEKVVQQSPSPPFITSTLQVEANRRLGFAASRTMRAAQELYEGAGAGEGAFVHCFAFCFWRRSLGRSSRPAPPSARAVSPPSASHHAANPSNPPLQA